MLLASYVYESSEHITTLEGIKLPDRYQEKFIQSHQQTVLKS